MNTSPAVLTLQHVPVRTPAERLWRAAMGGGGAGMIGAIALAGINLLITSEVARVRKVVCRAAYTGAPCADGVYGKTDQPPHTLPRLHVVMMGDSTSVGVGVDHPAETPGAVLAHTVADTLGISVQLTSVGIPGSDSTALVDQVRQTLVLRPDVVVLMVGTNDVKNRVPHARSVAELGEAVRVMRRAGIHVVVGTCPDLSVLHTFSWFGRSLARVCSKRLADGQAAIVRRYGGQVVSLRKLVSPHFRRRPGELFSRDCFHPSAAGYALACQALLPEVTKVARGILTNWQQHYDLWEREMGVEQRQGG